MLNEQAIDKSNRGGNPGHGRSIACDNMSGDNNDHRHSGERLSQNGDNKNLYLHDLKNVV